MRSARGIGSVYQPTYVDKQTRERKKSAVWWISYYHKGKKCRETSRDDRVDDAGKIVNEGTSHAAAMKLLKKRLGELAQGRPAGRDVERTTFGEVAEMLVADYKANGRRSVD